MMIWRLPFGGFALLCPSETIAEPAGSRSLRAVGVSAYHSLLCGQFCKGRFLKMPTGGFVWDTGNLTRNSLINHSSLKQFRPETSENLASPRDGCIQWIVSLASNLWTDFGPNSEKRQVEQVVVSTAPHTSLYFWPVRFFWCDAVQTTLWNAQINNKLRMKVVYSHQDYKYF